MLNLFHTFTRGKPRYPHANAHISLLPQSDRSHSVVTSSYLNLEPGESACAKLG